MSKSKEELNTLKLEYETVTNKLNELSDDELGFITGGERLNICLKDPDKEFNKNLRRIDVIAQRSSLRIIDGVNIHDIEDLSPEDIESVAILKDASSTAIYGTNK